MQKISVKTVENQTRLGGEDNLQRIVQKINLTIRTRGISKDRNLSRRTRLTKFSEIFRYIRDHLISARQPDLAIVITKKKENLPSRQKTECK